MEGNYEQMGHFSEGSATARIVLKTGSKKDILEIIHKVDSEYFDYDGETVLHTILRNENLVETDMVEFLKRFLIQGVDPNIINKWEETVLHLAVAKRMKNIIELLLEYNVDIHAKSRRGNSLAHFFINHEFENFKTLSQDSRKITVECHDKMKSDTVNFLQFLISKNVNFDVRNKQGFSALHSALIYYLEYCLPTLFEHTNDIKSVDKNGKTILEHFLEIRASLRRSYAFKNNNPYFGSNSNYAVKSVDVLLERGVPVSFDKQNVRSLIGKIYEDNEEEIRIYELLINHYIKNYGDVLNIFLHELIIIYSRARWLSDSFLLKILHYLVIKGADVNSYNCSTGERLVHTAIATKNLSILKFLKDNGADFSVNTWNDGRNSLHLLVLQKFDKKPLNHEFFNEACDLFVGWGCDVNAKCKRGKTALGMSIDYKDVSMVRKLIEIGADVNFQNEEMSSLLHEAVSMSVSDEIIELLLECGALVNISDSKGKTPLFLAVKRANLSQMRLFIRYGASINCRDNDFITPLHYAVIKGKKMELVEWLLGSGANPNAKDCKGNTPLHYAVRLRNLDKECIITLLLRNGTHVNTRNDKNKSSLYYAISHRATGTVDQLLQNGADLSDPSVRSIISYSYEAIDNKLPFDIFLIQYGIKLVAANKLPICDEYGSNDMNDDYQKYYFKCLQETEKLKSTFIDDHMTLYAFLNVPTNRRGNHIKNEKLKELVLSSTLNDQFPNYSTLIRACYHEALARIPLLERAREAWLSLTTYYLDFYSIDHLLSYLDDGDLINLTEASQHNFHRRIRKAVKDDSDSDDDDDLLL